MRKRSTQNFYENELKMMEERPSKKAIEIGKRPPYYLYANKFIDNMRELEQEQAIAEMEGTE